MKRLVCLLLSLCMVLGCMAFASADATVYEGAAQGFGSQVRVTVTVEDGKVTGLEVDDSGETYSLIGVAREDSVEKLISAILEAGTGEGLDAATGATFTSSAVLEVVAQALAGGDDAEAPLAFTAGEYEATAEGYNGPTTVKVTFSADRLEAVAV